MGSLIGYGLLGYAVAFLWIHRRRAQLSVVLVAALLVVAIGLSRLYLGVHYFSHVVGGYAAGVLWLSACISGLEVARRWVRAAAGRSVQGALVPGTKVQCATAMRSPGTTAFRVARVPPGWITYCTSGCAVSQEPNCARYVSSTAVSPAAGAPAEVCARS
jgi:PAP2 superfamily